MEKRIYPQAIDSVVMPEPFGRQIFNDAGKAVAALQALYDRNTKFLRDSFTALAAGGDNNKRYRAFYPEVGVTTTSFTQIDSRQAYGHMPTPGHFSTTITQPALFERYLIEQLRLIMRNHGVPVTVSESTTPIPLHFAFLEGSHVDGAAAERIRRPIRDLFDVPDLDGTDDQIANGTFEVALGEARPLAAFTAQRIDYSLHRMSHYTATSPQHFQNFVLFTNYQFYIDEFVARAHKLMANGGGGYVEFVEPGNVVTKAGQSALGNGAAPPRLPQMPAYHLKKPNHGGITMVNIGVGPSNAKTITDHIAVLRPHAWVMLGHCAGLRNTQALGDYVLAHAYVREDHVLDDDLPVWVPIPPLAEIQVAL
ncbi:MAG: AMP nucleosidase, partial [Mesorhizobium sp.]